MKFSKNIIFLLTLFSCISCGNYNAVYFASALPYWEGQTIKELPKSLEGDYYSTNIGEKNGDDLKKISISFPGNKTRIVFETTTHPPVSIYYDPITQKLHSSTNFIFTGKNELDNKTVRIIQHGKQYYFNVKQTSNSYVWWNCFVLTPESNNRLTITTSQFNYEYFKANRSYFKNNKNYNYIYERKMDDGRVGSAKLYFNAVDKYDLKDILEDDLLLKTYSLIRQ